MDQTGDRWIRSHDRRRGGVESYYCVNLSRRWHPGRSTWQLSVKEPFVSNPDQRADVQQQFPLSATRGRQSAVSVHQHVLHWRRSSVRVLMSQRGLVWAQRCVEMLFPTLRVQITAQSVSDTMTENEMCAKNWTLVLNHSVDGRAFNQRDLICSVCIQVLRIL